MQRCIELASAGAGNVAPNPLVGAVVVVNDKIIGEGYHRKYGSAHAEVNAIDSVTYKELLSECTLFVNLEPCSHTGKTPPCTDKIIASGIKNVVIGCRDPFDAVNGKGIAQLLNNGIKVTEGILEDKCKWLNRRFYCFHTMHRPYIILKWAESIDGFIGKQNERIQLSNHLSKIITHRMRSEEQAVMAGTNTVRIDNPQLNVRYWHGNDPVKITIDRYKTLDRQLNFFNGPSIVFTESPSTEEYGTQYIKIDFNGHIVGQMLKELHDLSIQSVLVEGGAVLLNSFIESGLWDEAHVFKTDVTLEKGIVAPKVTGHHIKEKLDNNDLIIWYKQ